ncbi:hypothetical protein EON63_12160, partial [archaeon]
MVGHDKLMYFLYLPYVLVFLFCYVVAVGYICAYYLDRKLYYTQNSAHQRHRQQFCCLPECNGCVHVCTPSVAYPLIRGNTAFQTTLFGDQGIPTLCAIRLIGLLITAYLVYFADIQEHGRHYYMWCGVGSGIYFFLLFFFYSLPETIKGCRKNIFQAHLTPRPNKPIQTLLHERIVSFLVVYRSVALANSVFVSVTQFDLYGGFTYINMLKLIPSICLALDYLCSLLPVNLEHYVYVLCLPYAYIHYHWVWVYIYQVDWESVYVELDSTVCFQNYCVLLAIHLGIYLVLCGVQKYVVYANTHTPMKCMYHIPEYAHILEMNTAHDNEHCNIEGVGGGRWECDGHYVG